MYFYHGDEHYYLTRIFLYDEDLREAAYSYGFGAEYERFAYALADELYKLIETYLINTGLSAEEYYEKQYEGYLNGDTASSIIMRIQSAIYAAGGKEIPWYLVSNKPLYISILKSVLYGSIKHFFFKNKDKYLPQYDWYLIGQNPKRQAIMDMLFKEFDKLTNMADSLRYYQDPDDIPLEFIIYLQEITGFSMNTYGGLFDDKQLRSLTKHLVEIWREKGATFSIELFFACMGIDCTIQELWFDRRRYYDPSGFNGYTNVRNIMSFGYYLTPNKPHTISYEYNIEAVTYADYTDPHSSRMWDYELSFLTEEEKKKKLLDLLGYGEDKKEDITYTYFKSNFLLFNFDYINKSKIIYQQELNVFKELISYMLPVYIRAYYGNEYENMYGNDEIDIFGSYDLDEAPVYSVTDIDGNERPAEPFQLFDTKPGLFSLEPVENIIGPDYVPAEKVGNKFVSGSYINVYDCRYTQYITNNGMFILTSDTEIDPNKTYYIINDGNPRFAEEEELVNKNLPFLFEKVEEPDLRPLVSSPYYDVVGGAPKDKVGLIDYPLYSDGTHEYIVTANGLTRNDGVEGSLVIKTDSDVRKDIQGADTLTRYYFKVNDVETEIHPNMFFDSNAGAEGTDQSFTVIVTEEGHHPDELFPEPEEYNPLYENSKELFNDSLEHQLDDWQLETFDQKYSNNPYNLFESSKWRSNIDAVNYLYDEENWNGYIQYEYSQFTNPLQYVSAKINSDITVELI